MVKDPKTIIFCAPSDFGFSDVIKQALQQEGFIVYDYPVADSRYRYKNIYERLQNTFRKVVFRDYSYKRKLKMSERKKLLLGKRESVPNATYAFIIRPDLFPFEFVSEIKNKVDKMVGYQWDGLQRFPYIFEYINLFDRFFVFDAKDLKYKKGLLPLTNFFIPKKIDFINKKLVYFIASYDDYRVELMKKLNKVFIITDLERQLYFITNEAKQHQNLLDAGLEIGRPLTYQENLKRVEQASLLIDIHAPVHAGLSFRVFEALNYNKKLITTNKGVRDYDFYHPNNIFIWDTENENDIIDFLKTDFVEIPKEIKNKYGFSNWINYVLDIGEYAPITIPYKEHA
ncbi:MAG: hypothetical protein LBE37_21535 [Sphingobacterium sp.]|jgi:hypothetical protein|nr:hypothetical protein [Sphingobacterium sp.]